MRGRMWMLRSLASAAVVAVLATGARAQATDQPAAIVNGEPILFSEVDAQVEVALKAKASTTKPTEAQRHQMQLDMLDLMIDNLILQQYLRANSPPADKAEVQKRLEAMEASLKGEGKTLQDFYRDSGQSEAQLRNTITNMIQWSNYVRHNLPDADVLKYYTENRDLFDQVTVRASHILLRIAPTSSDSEVQAARAKLQALRQQIVSGKLDFAEAAKTYSQCPSAPRGGDIGYFPRKWAVDESFAKAAFALHKDEISDVVQTSFGLHLIKVTDRKAGQPSNFDKVKDEVRRFAAEEMRQALLEQQRQTAKVDVHLVDGQGDKTARP